MKNTLFKRSVSFAAALAMTFSMASMVAAEDNAATLSLTTASADSGSLTLTSRENTYSAYYDRYLGTERPDELVTVNAADYTSASEDAEIKVETIEGKEALVWSNDNGSITYNVNVPTTGLYNLGIDYYMLEGGGNTAEFSMLIDGKSPYDTATRITLSKRWVNKNAISRDQFDNEVRPPQVEKLCWQSTPAKDIDGLFADPLLFYLEAGSHEITFESTKAHFAFSEFRFYNEEALPTYAEYVASVGEKPNNPIDITIEGEDAAWKSDQTLYPTYDRTSYITSPSNPTKMRYNTIGAENWSKATQSITYEVEMPTAGWVKLGIRARQNTMRGFYSARALYIDGEIPCEEAGLVKFYYSTDWTVTVPEDANGNDMYFYLDAGKHTITLEAVVSEIGDVMRRLDDVVFNLNTYYRNILQITGPQPDEWNDYMVDKVIPTLLPDFEIIAQQLRDEKAFIENLTGTEGSEAIALEKLALVLDRCIDKPDEIPTLLSSIKENITAVSSWMRQYREQPLELDLIEIKSEGGKFTSVKKNIFKSLSYNTKAFIGSFFEDYNSISTAGDDALNVWIALGRDQASVVKELVDSYYAPEHPEHPVAISLVVGGIIEATLAGKGPDVALFLGGDFPIQLAARGVVTDLTQFEDYDEVKERFAEHAMTLYTYNDGVYCLPVSQTFPMMFYRKDILQSYGFNEPPKTWDELIAMLPILQRNYMAVGLILPPTQIGSTTEAGSTFAMMLMQQGVNYYNDAQTATNFHTQEAVSAFEKWTKFYTTYSFEQTYDAFTRFRTGEMPILIQNYTFYNQLSAAAPEIKGLWSFTQVPGTEQADGTINHAANSAGAGAIIFTKCKNQQGAWEFIKWFTSTEIQIEYGNTIEAVMGALGRFDTANVEALQKLQWSQSELAEINAQMSELVEIPVIPASYAVTRNIMNAFRAVVNDADNARDTLLWYNRDINNEIMRKREDLGLPTE